MRSKIVAGLIGVMMAGVVAFAVQEAPEMPEPIREHQWLTQLAGEWETETSLIVDPTQPPLKVKGTASVRSIGGFWIVSEHRGPTPMGTTMTALLTLGYDPEKKKFVGTWIDSMNSHLWIYDGRLDEAGKVLTLETEGPNPMMPGKHAKYRVKLEVKSNDEKTLSSAVQGEDGQWFTFLTSEYRRKS